MVTIDVLAAEAEQLLVVGGLEVVSTRAFDGAHDRSFRSVRVNREAGCPPGAEAADHVGDRARPEALHGRGGEARLKPLVADQHQQGIATGQLSVAVRAARIQPPLEHIAGHDVRAGDESVGQALAV
jgi:hypothetical protein